MAFPSSKEEYFKKYGKDEFEFSKNQLVTFDFPKTSKRYYLVYESFSASIEETYYWILNQLTYDQGMPEVEKITDLFAASEHSTFFNVAAQRVGLNQDKVVQYLGSVGKLIKDLFQIVRELRILDERLEMYYKSKKMKEFTYDKKKWEEQRTPGVEESNEIALKGLYVDMAEGGSKNPASVFGMSQQLQYVTLPDLFFSIHPAEEQDIPDLVDSLQFNKQVKWVLKRKLTTYLYWKRKTYHEMLNRKRFTVKYLRQHYNAIKVYISWIKPYLKNVQRMRNDARKNESADLVSAFEGSLLEVEFVAKALPENNKKVYTCISSHFLYRTMPQMNYVAEGYQRAPLHVGEIKMQLRGYAWTQDEIDAYKKMREMEDLELAAGVEESLKASMDALGDDIEKYLEEAEAELDGGQENDGSDTPQKKPEGPGMGEPFTALLDAFASPLKGLSNPFKKTREEEEAVDLDAERENAKGDFGNKLWITYKNYKKSHKLVTW